MNIFANVVLFVIVLLFYLNLLQECKIGQDLDIYELDYQNTEKLYKICQTKQPVVFRMDQGEVIPDSHYINTISPFSLAERYGKEDVFLSSPAEEEPIPVPLQSAILLLDNDQQDVSNKMCENNHDFIMELPIHHYFQSIDPFLRPFGCIQTEYDMAFGATTQLRHHQHHSFFVYAVGGDLDVKITPHKNLIPFGLANPYDGYTYPDLDKNTPTRLNCWQDEEDDDDADITYLNVSVPAGFCLYIPPYWWFSIRQSGGWMAVFKYDTIMGRVVQISRQIQNNLLQWVRGSGKKRRENTEDEEEEEVEYEKKEMGEPLLQDSTGTPSYLDLDLT